MSHRPRNTRSPPQHQTRPTTVSPQTRPLSPAESETKRRDVSTAIGTGEHVPGSGRPDAFVVNAYGHVPGPCATPSCPLASPPQQKARPPRVSAHDTPIATVTDA